MTTNNQPQDEWRKLAQDALELAEKATAAPWGYKAGVFKHYAFSMDEQEDFGISLQEMHWNDGHEVPAAANAQFIAQSRQLVPDLAAALRAALDRIEELEKDQPLIVGIMVVALENIVREFENTDSLQSNASTMYRIASNALKNIKGEVGN